MFCKKCGNQIPDDAVFCQKCGQNQSASPAAVNLDLAKLLSNLNPKYLLPPVALFICFVLNWFHNYSLYNVLSVLNEHSKDLEHGDKSFYSVMGILFLVFLVSIVNWFVSAITRKRESSSLTFAGIATIVLGAVFLVFASQEKSGGIFLAPILAIATGVGCIIMAVKNKSIGREKPFNSLESIQNNLKECHESTPQVSFKENIFDPNAQKQNPQPIVSLGIKESSSGQMIESSKTNSNKIEKELTEEKEPEKVKAVKPFSGRQIFSAMAIFTILGLIAGYFIYGQIEGKYINIGDFFKERNIISGFVANNIFMIETRRNNILLFGGLGLILGIIYSAGMKISKTNKGRTLISLACLVFIGTGTFYAYQSIGKTTKFNPVSGVKDGLKEFLEDGKNKLSNVYKSQDEDAKNQAMLISLENRVQSQWDMAESAYKRRADLVPNLVETVKETFDLNGADYISTAVTEALSKVQELNTEERQNPTENADAFAKFQQVQDGLSSALSMLMVEVEKYPDLKDSQNFRDLQIPLEGSENRIMVERMRYNEAAMAFNGKRMALPSLHSRFKEKIFFQTQRGAETAPKVTF